MKYFKVNANCLLGEDYIAIDKLKLTSTYIIYTKIKDVQQLKRTLYKLTLLDETEEPKQFSSTIGLLSTEFKLQYCGIFIDSSLVGFRNVAQNGNFEKAIRDDQDNE